MSNTYDVGTKAGQPDQTEGWVASEVTKKVVDGVKVKLVFALENGEVRIIRLTRVMRILNSAVADQRSRDHTR